MAQLISNDTVTLIQLHDHAATMQAWAGVDAKQPQVANDDELTALYLNADRALGLLYEALDERTRAALGFPVFGPEAD